MIHIVLLLYVIVRLFTKKDVLAPSFGFSKSCRGFSPFYTLVQIEKQIGIHKVGNMPNS